MSKSMAVYRLRQGYGAQAANADLSGKLNDWLTMAGPNGVFRTCGTCRRMSRDGPAHCGLFNATPPIAVLLAGCDSHDDEMEPPF